MHDQVGDLCFISDGLAKRGILLRHSVMPGQSQEGKFTMQWLAKEVSSDLIVHCMEQYAPRAHVGKSRRRTKKSEHSPLESGSLDLVNQISESGYMLKPDKGTADRLRYSGFNRAVKTSEVDEVRSAAEQAGLWRFIDAAEHGMFHTQRMTIVRLTQQ